MDFEEVYYEIINKNILDIMLIPVFKYHGVIGERIYNEVYTVFHKLFKINHDHCYKDNDIITILDIIQRNIILINSELSKVYFNNEDRDYVYQYIFNTFDEVIELTNDEERYEMSYNITEVRNIWFLLLKNNKHEIYDE